jgi:hypothetical protein
MISNKQGRVLIFKFITFTQIADYFLKGKTMKTYKFLSVIAILVLLLAALPAMSVGAAPASNQSAQLNAAQCNEGELVINVTYKVMNTVDSGVAGNYWAYDQLNRHIQVWQTGSSTFCAVVEDKGAFLTIAGASPGNTDPDGIAAGITGTIQGGYVATITGALVPDPSYRTRGNIGTFDYQCDTAGNCPNAFNWVNEYFGPSAGFDFVSWGWTYHGGKNGTWVNSSDGNLGDITD